MRLPHLSSPAPAAPLLSLLLHAVLTLHTAHADYIPPINYAAVERRQTACPSSYFSCASQGAAFAGICCVNGQVCSLDSSSNPACCPSGYVCTGPAPTGTQTLPTGTAAVSYVTNAYFAFPAIPTSFSNAAACSSAVGACASNYAVCTSDLASGTGGVGVTINVPGGGGVTVAPTHTVFPVASATSMCSSLESAACYGLSSARCATAGSAGGFVVGTANAAAPRVTGCVGGMFGVMAGVGVGVLGAHI